MVTQGWDPVSSNTHTQNNIFLQIMMYLTFKKTANNFHRGLKQSVINKIKIKTNRYTLRDNNINSVYLQIKNKPKTSPKFVA